MRPHAWLRCLTSRRTTLLQQPPFSTLQPCRPARDVVTAAARKKGPRWSAPRSPRPAVTSSTEIDDDDKQQQLVYEGERVKIHSRNLPLKSIISDVDEGLLNLEPEYQRDFVWDAKKCMGLLKTVFEGLPMPAVMLHERTIPGKGVLSEVVDGKQRLVTLYAYIKGDNGRFPKAPVVIRLDPDEDELAPFLDGKAFHKLRREDQTRMQQYEVNVQSIPETTPLETVFRIYENINAGGMEHSPQQLRRAAFHGPYIKLLSRLAASEAGEKLRELAAVTEKEETEQLPEELILRFFALRRAGILSNNRRFRAPMKRFLNLELQTEGRDGRMVVWDLTYKDQEQMEAVFTNTIRLVDTLGLKDEAERALRSESGAKTKTFRKAAPVWDTTLVGLSLALDRNSNIGIYERNAAALTRNYGSLLRSAGWQAISNTLSHANLVKRLELFTDVVVKPAVKDDHRLPEVPAAAASIGEDAGVVEMESNASPATAVVSPPASASAAASRRRLFSDAHKAAAYARNPTCAWCGLPILDPAHAEADHVLPYALGGTTTHDNCQVLHRICNRERGARPMAEGPAAKRAAAGLLQQ